MRRSKREKFLAKMFRESMKPYEYAGEEWSEDEREFLPVFMGMMLRNSLILDLAGGYGRVTPYLMKDENRVVLADLSIHSLRLAKRNLHGSVDFVRADLLHLPFVENIFDGVWFTQAFEYVPPDFRETFLRDLNRIIRKSSVTFMNVAKVPNECSLFSYLRSYLYWKFVKRQPTILGDYIHKVNLGQYRGWHYHSVVFTRRIEKTFKKANFRILKSRSCHNGYLTYLLKGK